MRTAWTALGLAALLALAGGCEEPQSSTTTTDSTATKPATTGAARTEAPRVEMLVGRDGENWGKIVLELYPERAPKTVENFLRYVEEGYYDGTIFHRVVSHFMIQGGGFTAIGREKTEGLHPPIPNESVRGLPNLPGTIAMARTDNPHSATSQFFINVADNTQSLNANPPRWGYTVFGSVVEGMDVVDRIRNVETEPNPSMPGEKSQPVNPPVIKKVTVVK